MAARMPFFVKKLPSIRGFLDERGLGVVWIPLRGDDGKIGSLE